MGPVSPNSVIQSQQKLGGATLLGRSGILFAGVCSNDCVPSNTVLATNFQHGLHRQHCLAIAELTKHY